MLRKRNKGRCGRKPRRGSLEVAVTVVEVSLTGGDDGLGGGLHLLVDLRLGGEQGGLLDEAELVIVGKLAEQVDEGLLVVVVGFDGDFEISEGLLSVVVDLLRGHFTLRHVYLVTAQHDGDVGAHTADISVPVGHVTVGQTSRHIEHDDGSLATNVVTLTQVYNRANKCIMLVHQSRTL